MKEKERTTDFKDLLKSFFGNNEEEYNQEGYTEEEIIKKSDELNKKMKEDLLKSVVNMKKLETMLCYYPNKKTTRSRSNRLKVKGKGKENSNNIIQTKSSKNISGNDRGDNY